MKRFITVAALLLCAATLMGHSKIVKDSLQSKVLGRTVMVNVYLPSGYEKSPQAHYPAVYLLHGLYGTYTDWQKKGSVRGIADELIASGEACPMVIIMPNAGDPDVHHVQNGYFNMPGCRYEDFFFSELIPALEDKYRCGGAKGQRAVMGLSMGGGGSTVYAQRHPDKFASCYAMSAWLDNDMETVNVSDEDKEDKLYIVAASVHEHSALAFLDGAGEQTVSELRSVRWFLDCGDDDSLMKLSVGLYLQMRRLEIPCELRVRNGGHTWEYWHDALRLALPFAARNFTF